MYIVYCQNKPKSEHIVSEYIDTYFEVRLLNRFYTYRTLSVLYCPADSYFYLSPGPQAAIGPQIADHRPAHQTHPTYNEVPVAAEGKSSVILTLHYAFRLRKNT